MKNIVEQRFDRLIVLGRSNEKSGSSYLWEFLCVCGNTTLALRSNVLSGKTKSCGCAYSETRKAPNPKNRKHGLWGSVIYKTHKGMMERCYNPNYHGYKYWGGRGIKVCQEWHNVGNFARDMDERPGPEFSLDRINNNGNYEPGNCRWATQKEQQNNRRNNLKKKILA